MQTVRKVSRFRAKPSVRGLCPQPRLTAMSYLHIQIYGSGLLVRLNQLARRSALMDSKAILGICVLLSFIAFGRVAQLYIWSRVQGLPRKDALNALVVPHMFRFVGL